MSGFVDTPPKGQKIVFMYVGLQGPESLSDNDLTRRLDALADLDTYIRSVAEMNGLHGVFNNKDSTLKVLKKLIERMEVE